MNKTMNAKQQRGAVAIEFAALFLVFFMMLYAIIAYSVPVLLKFSFQHVSAEAGRAIYKVNPGQPIETYKAVLGREVNTIVEESWLPPSWRQGCPEPETEKTYQWEALAYNGASYGHFALDESNLSDPRFILHTCLRRRYKKDDAIIPVISFSGLEIPSLPTGEIKGETITRL